MDLENLIAEGYFRLRNERKKGLKCCAANEKGGQDGMKGSNPDYYWKEYTPNQNVRSEQWITDKYSLGIIWGLVRNLVCL